MKREECRYYSKEQAVCTITNDMCETAESYVEECERDTHSELIEEELRSGAL